MLDGKGGNTATQPGSSCVGLASCERREIRAHEAVSRSCRICHRDIKGGLIDTETRTRHHTSLRTSLEHHDPDAALFQRFNDSGRGRRPRQLARLIFVNEELTKRISVCERAGPSIAIHSLDASH